VTTSPESSGTRGDEPMGENEALDLAIEALNLDPTIRFHVRYAILAPLWKRGYEYGCWVNF
jgi:hypothetical protein